MRFRHWRLMAQCWPEAVARRDIKNFSIKTIDLIFLIDQKVLIDPFRDPKNFYRSISWQNSFDWSMSQKKVFDLSFSGKQKLIDPSRNKWFETIKISLSIDQLFWSIVFQRDGNSFVMRSTYYEVRTNHETFRKKRKCLFYVRPAGARGGKPD